MSTEAKQPTTRMLPRRAPMLFGLLLIGLGATAAMASQTGLSLAQSASIWILVCAAILLSFLIDRARTGARQS